MPPVIEPLCPRCHSHLPIEEVWSRCAYRGLRLLEPTGVRCPGCGTQLMILQARAVIASVVLLVVPPLALVAALLMIHTIFRWKLSEPEFLLLVLLVVPAGMFLQSRYVPRFCRVRPVVPGELVSFPLDRNCSVGI